jgi:hypothetical protein
MTIQSKTILKSYFNTGEVITQSHLHDQIDTFSSLPFSYTARTSPENPTAIFTDIDNYESSTEIAIPPRDTWLYDIHLLAVEDNYSIARWHFKFAVQNTGAIIAIVGQIQGDAANFDEHELITANYTEFNGTVTVYTTQPNLLAIEVTDADYSVADWAASGTIVKISKSASGSSGSS